MNSMMIAAHSSSCSIVDPNDAATTAANWFICQQKCCRPSKTDLLSEFVDPAEECHMTLQPDDETTVALKEQKRRKNLMHKRQGSDMTEATEAMFDYGDIDLSFLDDTDMTMMVTMMQKEEETEACCVSDDDISVLEEDDSCVDDVFRIVLDYPCSDDEEEELYNMPIVAY